MTTLRVFERHTKVFRQCIPLIQIFYAISFLLMFQSIFNVVDNLQGEISLVPSLFWLETVAEDFLSYQGLAYISLLLALPAFILPHRRSARILAVIGLFIFYGLFASIGNRQSAATVYVWIGLYLAFLPNWKNPSRSVRDKVIFGWWICTGLFLMTYCLSGLWKVYNGMIALPLQGEWGSFSPSAMANILSFYILRANQWSWLGEFVILNNWMGWPGYLGATFLEVFAPLPLFFSKSYRPMGVLLLIFHILSVYIFHIAFNGHVFLIFLMLFYSPFAKEINFRK